MLHLNSQSPLPSPPLQRKKSLKWLIMLNFEGLFINSKHFLKQTVKGGLHVRQIEMYKRYDNNVYKIKVFTKPKNDPVDHLR